MAGSPVHRVFSLLLLQLSLSCSNSKLICELCFQGVCDIYCTRSGQREVCTCKRTQLQVVHNYTILSAYSTKTDMTIISRWWYGPGMRHARYEKYIKNFGWEILSEKTLERPRRKWEGWMGSYGPWCNVLAGSCEHGVNLRGTYTYRVGNSRLSDHQLPKTDFPYHVLRRYIPLLD
jgi:hypothetical protein